MFGGGAIEGTRQRDLAIGVKLEEDLGARRLALKDGSILSILCFALFGEE